MDGKPRLYLVWQCLQSASPASSWKGGQTMSLVCQHYLPSKQKRAAGSENFEGELARSLKSQQIKPSKHMLTRWCLCRSWKTSCDNTPPHQPHTCCLLQSASICKQDTRKNAQEWGGEAQTQQINLIQRVRRPCQEVQQKTYRQSILISISTILVAHLLSCVPRLHETGLIMKWSAWNWLIHAFRSKANTLVRASQHFYFSHASQHFYFSPALFEFAKLCCLATPTFRKADAAAASHEGWLNMPVAIP